MSLNLIKLILKGEGAALKKGSKARLLDFIPKLANGGQIAKLLLRGGDAQYYLENLGEPIVMGNIDAGVIENMLEFK